jgi:pimeloyl-ACP methyl ester carboxylesterase
VTEPRPVSFLVDGLTYAGLEWGDPEARPVLALHGWLDNALSFSALAPLLDSTRLVAVDLSGQGLSDHRSADATYHIWDDVPQLLGVVAQLGVAEVVVMGHSRGAAIAVLLASALAERCAGLILLDGMLPVPVAGSAAALQFRQAMSDRLSLQTRTKRRFQDVEDFVAARVKLGFSADSARALVPRALRPVNGGYELVHDPRLSHASAVKLSQEMCAAFYGALNVRTLAVIAEQGLRARGEAEGGFAVSEHLTNAEVKQVPGGHHTHLEAGAPDVAACVNQFLSESPSAS